MTSSNSESKPKKRSISVERSPDESQADSRGGQKKTYVLVFHAGDEVMGELTRFAADEGLDAANLTALGAFSSVTLGFYDLEKQEYERNLVEEQVEVVSLVGNIAKKESGDPQIHAHAVVGLRDGTAKGEHLLEAHVQPTLEVVIVESPVHLRRRPDEASGLALIEL